MRFSFRKPRSTAKSPRFVLAATVSLAAAAVHAQAPAFPGAVGFGAIATGGRGGTVYHVTNLNDSGAGSFRDAVSQPNRIVVFDVGGYIVLKSPVSLVSNLTIAGQTAPGGGIGIMAGEVSASGKTNIILRNVRMRQGNQDPQTGKSAFNMGTGSNIILDHCSFAYGQWDSVDAVSSVNITVQNSLIANPIYQQFGAHVETGPSTFYRNLWVNAHNRQPLSKDNTQYINNVIYDYELGYTSGNTGGYFSHDLINNYFIAGPMTTVLDDDWFQMNNKQSVFASGNMVDGSPDGLLDGIEDDTVDASIYLTAPWAPTTTSIPTLSAPAAVTSVMATAGAFPRDEVDTFALSDVSSFGTRGSLYKDQGLTGIENDGYGVIAGGTPLPDANADAIADFWEQANGISTTDPAAGSAAFGSSGYSNVEAYINSLILPNDWSAADLGTVTLNGASTYNGINGQWVLTGSGANGPTSPDEAQFASHSFNSDGTLTAQISAVTAGQAGLLIRDTTSPTSAFVTFVVDSTGTVSLYSRATDGAGVTGLQQSAFAPGVTLRLMRSNSTVYGFTSTDGGATFKLFGTAQVPFSSTARVGLATTSGSATSRSIATFSNVALNVGPTAAVLVPNQKFVYGSAAPTTLTATVAYSGGQTTGGVSLSVDGSNPQNMTCQSSGNGTLACSTDYPTAGLSNGTHTLNVALLPDSGYVQTGGTGTLTPGSSKPTVQITVPTLSEAQGTASTTITVNGTFTAGVIPTGATVIMVDNAQATNAACSLTSSSTATCTATLSTGSLAPGAHTLTAVSNGDGNYQTGYGSGTLNVTASTPSVAPQR